MGGMPFAQLGEQFLWLLAGDLQPKGIGAKIKFAGPRQDSALSSDGGAAEECIVGPWRKNSFACMRRKIHFPFGTIFEPQPDTISVKYFSGHDLCHKKHDNTLLRSKIVENGDVFR